MENNGKIYGIRQLFKCIKCKKSLKSKDNLDWEGRGQFLIHKSKECGGLIEIKVIRKEMIVED